MQKLIFLVILFSVNNCLSNDSLCEALNKKDINKMTTREYDYFKFCKQNAKNNTITINNNSEIESRIDFLRAKQIAMEAVTVIAAYESASLACLIDREELCKINEMVFELPKSEWFDYYEEQPGKFVASLKKNLYKFQKGTKWISFIDLSDQSFLHEISDIGAVLLTPFFTE